MDDAFTREGRSIIDRLDGPLEGEGITRIKSNMVRTVFRIELENLAVFLKIYHRAGLCEGAKSLILPSKAALEWKAMNRLRLAEIPTARPILYGELRRMGFLKRACFAATEIPGALSFGAFVEKERAAGGFKGAVRRDVYRKLAVLTAKLHAEGVRHGDYHLGNILVTRCGENPLGTHLIDLHNVSFPRRLSRDARILNLARFGQVLMRLDGGEDFDFFLDCYQAESGEIASSTPALRRIVEKVVAKLERRRLKSRTRRCMKKSSEFTPAVMDGYTMHLRRSFSPDLIVRAIELHKTVEKEGDPRLLHPVLKNKVTVVEVPREEGGIKLCVKEYRPKSWPRRRCPYLSEARRAWIAGRGLEVREIPTPETVAWVRGGGREYLVTRYVEGGENLHGYTASRCVDLNPRQAADLQRVMAAELAVWVKKVHDNGVRHRDLSEKNILVEEKNGKRTYYLIDCDTLSFGRALGEKLRTRNLVQLGHMPEDIDVLAKARFLERYLGRGRDHEWRAAFERLNRGIMDRMARTRQTFARYNAPDPHPRPSRLKGQW